MVGNNHATLTLKAGETVVSKTLNSDGLLYTSQCSWHVRRITVWPFVGKYYRLSLPREVQKQSVHTTASIGTDNQSRDDEYRGVLLGKDLRFEVASAARETDE